MRPLGRNPYVSVSDTSKRLKGAIVAACLHVLYRSEWANNRPLGLCEWTMRRVSLPHSRFITICFLDIADNIQDIELLWHGESWDNTRYVWVNERTPLGEWMNSERVMVFGQTKWAKANIHERALALDKRLNEVKERTEWASTCSLSERYRLWGL